MEGVLTTDFVVLIPNVQVNFCEFIPVCLFCGSMGEGGGLNPQNPSLIIRPWKVRYVSITSNILFNLFFADFTGVKYTSTLSVSCLYLLFLALIIR